MNSFFIFSEIGFLEKNRTKKKYVIRRRCICRRSIWVGTTPVGYTRFLFLNGCCCCNFEHDSLIVICASGRCCCCWNIDCTSTMLTISVFAPFDCVRRSCGYVCTTGARYSVCHYWLAALPIRSKSSSSVMHTRHNPIRYYMRNYVHTRCVRRDRKYY